MIERKTLVMKILAMVATVISAAALSACSIGPWAPPPEAVRAAGSDKAAMADDGFRDIALQHALSDKLSAEPHHWGNPVTGRYGTIMPVASYRTSKGYYCRRYLEHLYEAGIGWVEREGVACRDDRGVWLPVAL